MGVGFWEEEEDEEGAAAAQGCLEPEDDAPGAKGDNYALVCYVSSVDGLLEWRRHTPRNGPKAGPIRVPERNHPSAVARARGSYTSPMAELPTTRNEVPWKAVRTRKI